MQGLFLGRRNRFIADVRLFDGAELPVHIASSGRMAELLIPGAPVIVSLHEPDAARKTAGRLLMVRTGQTWVSVDTSLPGRLFRAAFADGRLPGFEGYTMIRPEYTYGESRIDFLLTAPESGLPPCLVEVKSVTSVLAEDGRRVARFPDAPTLRGAKHLRELVGAREQGYRTAVCFIIQRDDADHFGPYDAIDAAFGEALRAAARAGVEVHAWLTHVTPDAIQLGGPVPLELSPG